MPQMLNIQPVPPQAPPSTLPGKKEQKQFSPHLDNAISDVKQQGQNSDDKYAASTDTDDDTQTTDISLIEEDPAADSLQVTLLSHGKTLPVDENQEVAIESDDPDSSTAADLSALFTAGVVEQTLPDKRITSVDSPGIEIKQKETRTAPPSVAIEVEPTSHAKVSQPSTSSWSPVLTVSEGQSPQPETVVAKYSQDTLIGQLERIIQDGNEKGTVSITRVDKRVHAEGIRSTFHGIAVTSAVPASQTVSATDSGVQTIKNPLEVIVAADFAGNQNRKDPLNTTQHDNQGRYDVARQNIRAQLFGQAQSDNNQNLQNEQQNDTLAHQTFGTTSQNGLAGATEQTNTFAVVGTTTQESSTLHVIDSPKPVILPSGIIVQEDEILQQVTNKIRLAGRQQDSRINLRLHPAELGELKIDLSVKEGAIRANVVAQSQQTVDILEKNLQRLKAELESQGFAVDQIMVSTDSESVGDFDLFDRQHFSNDDYNPPATKKQPDEEAVFTLEDSSLAANVSDTGVNVKI